MIIDKIILNNSEIRMAIRDYLRTHYKADNAYGYMELSQNGNPLAFDDVVVKFENESDVK